MKLALLIARGIARDQAMRRKVMFAIVLTAIVLLFLGATFLDEMLGRHLLLFLIYWVVCGWLTLTAILMAIYDLLSLRAQARNARDELKRQIFGDKK